MARAVEFEQLFEGLGSFEMRYNPRAAALSGQAVEIEGVLAPVHLDADRFLLTDRPGQCADCSPVPVPAIFLPDLYVPKGNRPGETWVRVRGILRFGFEVRADGYASFIRIEDATIVTDR